MTFWDRFESAAGAVKTIAQCTATGATTGASWGALLGITVGIGAAAGAVVGLGVGVVKVVKGVQVSAADCLEEGGGLLGLPLGGEPEHGRCGPRKL